MAQKAQDQRRSHPKFLGCINTGAVQSVDNGCRTQAVVGVGLGVKEKFGVNYVIRLRTGQVSTGQIVKIFFGF